MNRLSYLIVVWGNSTETTLRKAQVVQNIAGRFVTGQGKRMRQQEIMKECNWLTMEELTRYCSLVQLWKATRLQKPDYLWSCLQEDEGDRLSTEIPRLQLTSNAFRCNSVRQWNQMSSSLRTENSLGHFKTNLKKEIIANRVSREPG